MANRLLVIDGDDQGHFFLSVEGQTVTIGGSPAHAPVVLRDLHIARIRCEVEVEEDLVVVSEVANATGTPEESPAGRRELRPGGALVIGNSHLRLEPAAEAPLHPLAAKPLLTETLAGSATASPGEGKLVAPAIKMFGRKEESPASSSATPAGASPAAAGAAAAVMRLLVIDGADKGRFFNLPASGSVTFGNSIKNADFALHDLAVSRVHCEVEMQDGQIFVTHVEGQNGTLINGQQIAGKQELRQGDILRIGNSHLRLETAKGADGPSAAAAGTGSGEEEPDVEAFEVVEDETVMEVVEEVVEETLEAELVEEAPAEPAAGSDRFRLPHPPVDKLVELEDQVLGHYQIGALLGRGHSGLVFRAKDVKSEQVVALKVLSPDFPASPAELQRFVQALKGLPQLQDPHLVGLHGAGKAGPYCWIAREYVEGESLNRLIGRLIDEGKLKWTRACRVAVHLGMALAFLQKHKVVHGNVTPRNILIRSSDKATKLADTMLVKALEGSRLQQTIRENKLLVELPYQAPEQIDPNMHADYLTDLYGLGAVVYHLLTGQPPFSGTSADEIAGQIRKAKVLKPSKLQRDIPVTFEAVVLKLLAKHRIDRYASAQELVAALEPIVREHMIKM